MKILDLNIKGFGKFHDTKITFDPKLNIIFGNNESGKSTTHTFIKSMLFGIKTKKSKNRLSDAIKYKPWENEKIFEGTLRFSYKDKNYIINRNFGEENNTLEILNETDNIIITEPNIFLNKVLSNLNMTSYDNTISISQLCTTTESSMVFELKRYITNLNTAGDLSINTISAIEMLKNQKATLEDQILKDATIIYTKHLSTIRNLEKEINNPTYENKTPEYSKEIDDITNKIIEQNTKINNLQNEIEKKEQFIQNKGFNNKSDIDDLKNQVDEIYNEYLMLKESKYNVLKIFINGFKILIGFLIFTISTVLLAISYPSIATFLNLRDVKILSPLITKFITKFSFPIAPIIGFLYCISLILIILGFVSLITKTSDDKYINDITKTLSEIFLHQIDTNTINKQNFILFENHINNLYNEFDNISNYKTEIKEIENEIKELTKNSENLENKITIQKDLQSEVDEKIDRLTKLKEQSEKFKKDISFNDDTEREIESLSLAIETLIDLTNKIKVLFGANLNEKTSKYLKAITNGKYDSVLVDDALNVSIISNGKIIPIEQLSSGTIDQIYLSLRLATIDIINTNNEKLPLILDDCFALYDNDRIKNTLTFLNKYYDGQLIIFTCHERENKILNDLHVPLNIINFNQNL